MNLNAFVSSAISAVNPNLPVLIRFSLPPGSNADGTASPDYSDPLPVLAQVQPLAGGDLRHVDALNLQGSHRVMYVNLKVRGAVRYELKGGDLVTLPDQSVWLVTQALEPFYDSAGWNKVLLTLQDGS